jgi:hypothetical protein
LVSPRSRSETTTHLNDRSALTRVPRA